MIPSVQRLYTMVSLLLTTMSVLAQSTDEATREVEIVHADKLQYTTLENNVSYRKLVGNVQLKQDETLMFCDSAYMDKESNSFDAYGHVRINESDSIQVYSDYLMYDGNERKAHLYDNVRLLDDSMVLYTDYLIYDIENKTGIYTEFGRLVDGETVLTSKKGYYYSELETAFFKDSIVVVNPDYKLLSDTLSYHIQHKRAVFYGPTQILNDSSTIQCESGWYHTEEQVASFGANTIVNNPPQILYTDSLYYEHASGYGKVLQSFLWIDEEMDIGIEGTFAEYFERNQTIKAYQNPLLYVIVDNDSLFVVADQIHLWEREDTAVKEFNAYHDVRIYKSDMQGICDSLFYSSIDSLFTMYTDPILWNDENEMRGDTIHLLLKNQEIYRAHFVHNAFMVSQSLGKLFDQIQSDVITGYFTDGQLKKMLCDGQAESLYFGKNEQEAYVGGNKAIAEKMWVYIDSSRVQKITFLAEPKAVFSPISQMAQSDLYLQRFKWNVHRRPASKRALFEMRNIK